MDIKVKVRTYMADSADIENPIPRAELSIRDGIEVDHPFKSIEERRIHVRAIRSLVEGLQDHGVKIELEIVDNEEVKAARRNSTGTPSLSSRR